MKKILCILTLLVLSGCSSDYMKVKPVTFDPCGSVTPDPQRRALGAIIKTIESRRGWYVRSVDSKEALVSAEVCRRNNCIPVNLKVQKNGVIELLRGEKSISSKWGKTLRKWVLGLEERYWKVQCYHPDQVNPFIEKYAGKSKAR
ncbi:MAG: hypothetical protein RQ824_01265 [bacterium]|nr:hypothetical protein [bacterium]